jgi:photosystem II stability/assembly factor-like uncharacterized protein
MINSYIFNKNYKMRYLACLLFILFISCKETLETQREPFTSVQSVQVFNDSTSIRAIEVSEEELVFAGSNGVYGYFTFNNSTDPSYPEIGLKNSGKIDFLDTKPSFRAIAITANYIFMLSIAQPALLYKYDKSSHKTDLVYIENTEGVFYDSLTFWNDQEGIGMGDPLEGCLSIIVTRDGGNNWSKISCDDLPKTTDGEAAFAASDTNISVFEDHTWIITGGKKSRVLYSPDKGTTWQLFDTPLVQGGETTGGYSIDFYDDKNGVIYGGDYLNTDQNDANIAMTKDGGRTWGLVGVNLNQGYKSCVQYVPNSSGKELVAMGFTGISYSSDQGQSWKEISKEGYLSFRFLNDSIAYASGKNTVAQLNFR